MINEKRKILQKIVKIFKEKTKKNHEINQDFKEELRK